MIIDSHTHVGDMLNFHMPEKVLLESMNKYKIAFSLCSNIKGTEVDHKQNLIDKEKQISQYDINTQMINFAKENKNRIGVMLWIKPLTECCDETFEKLVKENRDVVYGIKVHPYHSKVAFNSEKTEEYFKLASKYGLTVVTHTANDYESSPQLVYEMAKKYSDINFVMYHMGLGTDNCEAIDFISTLPNLYGDTAWVKSEKVVYAIKKCGSHKILFGTDSPINGIDTYNSEYYNPCYHELQKLLTEEEYSNLMYKNAIDLFGLDVQNINSQMNNPWPCEH